MLCFEALRGQLVYGACVISLMQLSLHVMECVEAWFWTSIFSAPYESVDVDVSCRRDTLL